VCVQTHKSQTMLKGVRIVCAFNHGMKSISRHVGIDDTKYRVKFMDSPLTCAGVSIWPIRFESAFFGPKS
jgi:hypothetical protein